MNIHQDDKFFDNFKYTKLGEHLYLIDVLGDNIQEKTNKEWRKLGEQIARHIISNDQKAFLVSTMGLDYYISKSRSNNLGNSVSFEHEKMVYKITPIDLDKTEILLPDIIESEEFVFGLNVWIYIFDRSLSNEELLNDEGLISQVKFMVSNLNILAKLETNFEFIAAVPDGCEMLWFNPVFKNNKFKN